MTLEDKIQKLRDAGHESLAIGLARYAHAFPNGGTEFSSWNGQKPPVRLGVIEHAGRNYHGVDVSGHLGLLNTREVDSQFGRRLPRTTVDVDEHPIVHSTVGWDPHEDVDSDSINLLKGVHEHGKDIVADHFLEHGGRRAQAIGELLQHGEPGRSGSAGWRVLLPPHYRRHLTVQSSPEHEDSPHQHFWVHVPNSGMIRGLFLRVPHDLGQHIIQGLE